MVEATGGQPCGRDAVVIETPTLLLAFAAGFVSFVSPCCLPLVPGYLAGLR